MQGKKKFIYNSRDKMKSIGQYTRREWTYYGKKNQTLSTSLKK